MSVKFISIPDKRLAASILGTDMSFRVSNILGWDGEDISAADFGTVHYVAFRNSANTALELMEIDPSTIASGSITINKRGLEFTGDLTTEVAANKRLWVKGDTIVSFGTNPPQLYQYLKEYIDGVAVAGAPDGSTTIKGVFEEATQAEVRARTASGGTSAHLVVNPSTLPNVLIADYVADTGTADAYLIAPSPAIVAYVTGQQFTFKATNANTTTSTVNVNSLGTKTIKKLGGTNLAAGDIAAGMIVQIEYDGTNFQMLNPVANAPATSADFLSKIKFGGTGADGALSISSGTTTIDLGGARVVVKNYTTISITGTGALAFSNPHANGTTIIFKATGDVSITTSATRAIDLRSLGGAGGTASSSGGGSPQEGRGGGGGASAINDGNPGGGTVTSAGPEGSDGSPGIGFGRAEQGFGGAHATVGNLTPDRNGSGYGGKAPYASGIGPFAKALPLVPGAGGGSGGNANGTASGAGGRGAGALYIECAGAYNCTGTIDASGSNGGSSSGGGGGGVIFVLYKTLTGDSGTYTITKGTGGAALLSNAGGDGGDGYAYRGLNTEFI